MDFNKITRELIGLAGGVENISSVTHCSTRLRFFIKDKSKVNKDAIANTEPVLGVVFQTDELQMVFGKNVIPFYNEASRIFNEEGGKGGASEAPAKKGPKSASDIVNVIVGFVSAAVTPLIPGLVAGGMLKVFLLLATLAIPTFADTNAYTLLSQLANVPFYFMPIFVAYGAAKKLGGTPLYAMAVAGALLYPDFLNMWAEDGAVVTIFNLPVTKVSYSSTLLPALLIGLFAYYCEKALTKIIPGILRTVLVGMLTMGITYTVGIVVLGPLGDVVGSVIVNVFLWASNTCGPIAIGLLAACMPWLVMTGMHHAVTPFMVQAFADPGYDVFFRPSYILHNMAEGGACIGVALRTKSKEFRAECLSLAFGCIVAGVTEPALYGVNFKLKRPMVGIMAGGAAGGITAGLMGVCAYVYGYSTILALPIFQDTMIGMAIAIAVDIVVAAVVTFILGFEDVVPAQQPKLDAPKAETVETKAAPATVESAAEAVVAAPVEGNVIPMEEIPDAIFAGGVLGNGVGIQPEKEEVRAPFDGSIESVTDTKHAVGITSAAGVEMLIHVGIDTVKMEGKGFECLVKEGDTVKKGQTLIRFSKKAIKEAGFNDTVAVLVSNADDYDNFKVLKTGKTSFGESIITVS